MFRFFKDRAIANDVETSMAYLLAFKSEPFVRGIYKHYPNARKLAISEVNAGQTHGKVASNLLRIVLTDQVTRFITTEQREQLVAFLRSDDSAVAAPFPLANLCKAFIGMLYRESDIGKLDPDWVRDCVHDVYFAAKGLSADERSNDRMVRAIDRAFAGVGADRSPDSQ